MLPDCHTLAKFTLSFYRFALALAIQLAPYRSKRSFWFIISVNLTDCLHHVSLGIFTSPFACCPLYTSTLHETYRGFKQLKLESCVRALSRCMASIIHRNLTWNLHWPYMKLTWPLHKPYIASFQYCTLPRKYRTKQWILFKLSARLYNKRNVCLVSEHRPNGCVDCGLCCAQIKA